MFESTSVADSLPTSKMVCEWLGASWGPVTNQNFDDILKALMCLFEMATTEGWVDIMHAGVDARGIDMHPIRGTNGSSFSLSSFSVYYL